MKLPLMIMLLCGSLAQVNAQKKYIDRKNMDESVRPGDNFFQYANGKWLRENPVPASKTRWGSFNILAEEANNALRKLLEGAVAHPEKSRVHQLTGYFYKAAMDSASIEKNGYSPIIKDLAQIDQIANPKALLAHMIQLRKTGIASPLFGFFVGQDQKQVNKYILQLGQGGTTLPDRDYYLKNDNRSTNIRKAYLSYIKDMFQLAGTSDTAVASGYANSIMALETQLAAAQMSRVEMRDPQKTYNKFSITEFSANRKVLDWKDILLQFDVKGQDSLVVNNPSFLRITDSLLNVVPLDQWKAYLKWYVIRNAAPYLSNVFVQRNFEFNKVLSGQKEITPRWQRMVNLVDGNLGELLGQLYVAGYFKPAAKSRMIELVGNLEKSFEERIKKLDWMSDVTKEKALIKLHTFHKKIGYTDKWKTYEGIVIVPDNLLANVRHSGAWGFQDRLQRLGKPVDETEWNFTPPTINASYSSLKNEITFPAGILQFPFFDADADDAVNYGGIGAVIGHEITHGFDDSGRQYDADGNLNDWWTAEDARLFKERADLMVNEYNGFVVLDSLHVNGKLTLGENIADLGGINMAYDAFLITAQAKAGKKIDGFTPQQRFFLSWAQIWRVNALPETAAQLIVTDPHSPELYRVNGILAQLDAFYEAFQLAPGDKMFKPTEKRIRIW